jgi:hypothetical protein
VRLPLVVAAACLALTSCTGGGQQPRTEQAPTTTAPSPSGSVPVTADKTVWLCRPGATPDPCEASLTSTAVLTDGAHRAEPQPHQQPAAAQLDCFYVYPTVSREATANADLQIQPVETSTAIAQASRFSTTCRVWAPMYHKRTVGDLFNL